MKRLVACAGVRRLELKREATEEEGREKQRRTTTRRDATRRDKLTKMETSFFLSARFTIPCEWHARKTGGRESWTTLNAPGTTAIIRMFIKTQTNSTWNDVHRWNDEPDSTSCPVLSYPTTRIYRVARYSPICTDSSREFSVLCHGSAFAFQSCGSTHLLLLQHSRSRWKRDAQAWKIFKTLADEFWDTRYICIAM